MASYLDKDGLQTVWSKMKTWVDGLISARKPDILNSAYPVGAIYMSMSSTSPASLFGGTWEQLKDRFLIGAGGSYNVGGYGGETGHTLTIDEIPKHAHKVMYAGGTTQAQSIDGVVQPNLTPGWIRGIGWWPSSVGGRVDVWADSTGGSQPHNNMPPFLSVYMWKRTA